MINAAGKTAITRKTLSTPMKWLDDHHMLACNRPNRRLDYGCGKGFDADLLGMHKSQSPAMGRGRLTAPI